MGGAQQMLGAASDTYNNSDVGTVYDSGTYSYTDDVFNLYNATGVRASDLVSMVDSTSNEGDTDVQVQSDTYSASGHQGTGGQSYAFSQMSSQSEVYNASETMTGTSSPHYSVNNSDYVISTDTEAGTVSGSGGDSFSLYSSLSDGEHIGSAGEYIDAYSSLGAFGGYGSSTDITTDTTTNPTLHSMTYSSDTSTSTEYPTSSNPAGDDSNVREALMGAAGTAGHLGAYRGGAGGAVHMGTGSGPLDNSSGLLSALGGGDMEAMVNPNGEITESLAEGDGAVLLMEDGSSAWVASPGGQGYPGSSSNGGMIGGAMSTGTANGSMANVQGQMSNGTTGTTVGESGATVSGVKGAPERPSGANQGNPKPPPQMRGAGVETRDENGDRVYNNSAQGPTSGASQGDNSYLTGSQLEMAIGGFLARVFFPETYQQGEALDDQQAALNQSLNPDPLSNPNAPLTAGSLPRWSGDSTKTAGGRVGGLIEQGAASIVKSGVDQVVGALTNKALGFLGSLLGNKKKPLPKGPAPKPKPKQGFTPDSPNCFVAGTDVLLGEDDPRLANIVATAGGPDDSDAIETSGDRGLAFVAGVGILVGIMGLSYANRMERRRRGEEDDTEDREEAVDEILDRWRSDVPSLNRRKRMRREPWELETLFGVERFTASGSIVVGLGWLDLRDEH